MPQCAAGMPSCFTMRSTVKNQRRRTCVVERDLNRRPPRPGAHARTVCWHAHVAPRGTRRRPHAALRRSHARSSMAARRDENYVDGAEFDDSDELIEEHSDDSDEFHALPSLANTSLKSTLGEKAGSKRKASEAHDDTSVAGSASRADKRKQGQKNSGYSWEAAYQRSWDHVQEDESGNLESAVRQMLEVNKRKRSLRDSAPVQRGIIRHLVLVLDLSEDMMDRDLRPTRYVLPRLLTW